ncbi:phenylalanine--tRNA ligase subunit beta [Candidatus Saccharibacteria bacterium]|nr:phenylalanine--tRNA ligase subunit beta [Candidatus Saccharibacteria bacterium]
MRISLNWLKKYVDIKISDEELVRLIGARLVEVEGVIDETHKYDNIYIVRVESTEKIPDTHLTLCKINVGDVEIKNVPKVDGLVQVMCGAPNVHAGMMAAWIAPGAIVPASVHEDAPFVIGKRTMLKKYDSYGMLAAADELDLGVDHEGIIEIDPEAAKPGEVFADVFDLKDKILDIENKSLTHRPDCFGLIGFAREVAGILGQKFEEPDFLTHEAVFEEGFLEQTKNSVRKKGTKIKIEIEDAKICPRYTCAQIKIVDPLAKNKYFSLVDALLAKSGMHSVSKIVDVTNYLMLLTGQPLHAFDCDKFNEVGKTSEPKIIVRLAKDGERIELLDGTILECTKDDILITSNNVPVGLAGAMGGANTMIDENTKNVLLEVATFSLYNLRKTQMAHGIFSEAITRYTKGVPASGTFNVLAEAVKEINGKVIDMNDEWLEDVAPNSVEVSINEINGLLGTDYDESLIIKTLSNVGFDIEKKGKNLLVFAPIWRTDIHIGEDITEEVGRLLGYDNIAPVLPLHLTAERNPVFVLRRRIREMMAKYGASEVLTYSFVSGRLLEKAGQDSKNSYKIVNSISPELQYIRQSIVPSLLDKTYMNEKMPVEKFALFEMNAVYRKELGMDEENVPVEKYSLGFVVAERKNKETAFYKAKKYAAKLFEELSIDVEFLPISGRKMRAEEMPFESKRSAEIISNGKYIGIVGEFKNSVKADFKLAPYVAGFEIDMDYLVENAGHKKIVDFGNKKHEDLTITTDGSYAEVLEKVQKDNPGAKITPGVIYQADGQKTRNITFHIEKK